MRCRWINTFGQQSSPPFSTHGASSSHFDGGVFLDVFLTITAIVRDRAGAEINVVSDDTRTPRGSQELREGAVASLIDAQGCNQSFVIKQWHVHGARHEWSALRDNRSCVRDE
jgi:hypothetical protein